MKITWNKSNDVSKGQMERLEEIAEKINKLLGDSITDAKIDAPYDLGETITFYKNGVKINYLFNTIFLE